MRAGLVKEAILCFAFESSGVKESDLEHLDRMDSQRQYGGKVQKWFRKGLERCTALMLEKLKVNNCFDFFQWVW